MQVTVQADLAAPVLIVTPDTEEDTAVLRAMLEAEHASAGRIRLISSSYAAGEVRNIVMGLQTEPAR